MVHDPVILRVRKTATENVYLAQTMAESFVDASGQRKNLGSSIGMTVDSADNVYVADTTYKVIRKISSTGMVTTLAGSGVAGTADGTGTAAAFQFGDTFRSMSHDANGNLYIEGDYGTNVVRKITAAGVVTTIAIPSGYWDMTANEAGQLYFVATTATGIPSIIRIGATGAAEVLVSRGSVNFDTAPNFLQGNAIGYVKVMRVSGGYIYVAGHNPMAIYKIKI